MSYRTLPLPHLCHKLVFTESNVFSVLSWFLSYLLVSLGLLLLGFWVFLLFLLLLMLLFCCFVLFSPGRGKGGSEPDSARVNLADIFLPCLLALSSPEHACTIITVTARKAQPGQRCRGRADYSLLGWVRAFLLRLGGSVLAVIPFFSFSFGRV